MGNFSRDTFDKLKHYVGVRLQQGVPLVDADWNEQEDIRRYELQAFLKWFVGNGVPEGNDGFRIISIVNKIILTSKKNDDGVSSVEVNRKNSTAAEILGFGPSNYLASRAAPPAAQLTGEVAGDFKFEKEGLTLVVSADGMEEKTVTFKKGNFRAAEVVAAINSAMSNLTASAGTGNDFDIKGGDGTAEGAGRCLVEGWDVINESDLRYTKQPLYKNDALAEKWDVKQVKTLTPPSAKRTDTVYLDVWEREVDTAEEDKDLVNPEIGVETCVRLKCEWVVRVAEGAKVNKLPTPSDGHVYYPLATLTRQREQQAIESTDITDLRRTDVNATALADEIEDARGIKGNLGNRLDESLTKGGQLRHNVVGNDQLDTATRGKLVTNGDSHDHSGGDGAQIKHSSLNLDDGRNPHGMDAADMGALSTELGGVVKGRTGFEVPKGGASNAALMAAYGAFGADFNPSFKAGLGVWADAEADYGVFIHHYGGISKYALRINQGKAYFGGGKEGFVTDRFVNASGTTLRTGDIVKLKKNGSVRFHGDLNRIPVNEVTLTDQEDDHLVIGVVDTEALPLHESPDTRSNPEDPFSIPDGGDLMVVTLGAYAKCNADATEVPIEVGDLLTSSANLGHAKKAMNPKIGSIIGKALEPLREGTGYIAVFVNIQ